jgi:hypothetical protein
VSWKHQRRCLLTRFARLAARFGSKVARLVLLSLAQWSAWAPRLRRYPSPARVSAVSGHRACRSLRCRSLTGTSGRRRRYSNPTYRSHRLDSSRPVRAQTESPLRDPPWAPSAKAHALRDAFSCDSRLSMLPKWNLTATYWTAPRGAVPPMPPWPHSQARQTR